MEVEEERVDERSVDDLLSYINSGGMLVDSGSYNDSDLYDFNILGLSVLTQFADTSF